MAAESENDLQHEIGHVLFIDMVGYSKLLIDEQKERLRRLTEIVLATSQVARSTNEQLVRLPTGDGMALVFRHSVEEPVQCALEIAQALQTYPEITVRMGVHSGPISGMVDVSGKANIAGTGINVAQRVMDCGDAGHILLSQRVAQDLAPYRQWSGQLHDLGECEVKHGVKLHLFNLYAQRVGNAATPAKLKAAGRPGQRGTRSYKFVPLLVPVLVLLLGVVLYSLGLFSLGKKEPAAPATAAEAIAPVPEKSVAVLPFENLSSDKENAYFADGVQDEILTDLAKIADLKVISRTSVMQYKSGVVRNLREIGQQLGVAHLLEGSVQRAPIRCG